VLLHSTLLTLTG